MEQVRTRTQELAKTMTSQMEKLQASDRSQAQAVIQLSESLTAQALETRRTVTRLGALAQDGDVTRDRDLDRIVERLRQNMETVTNSLDDMVLALELMNTRLLSKSGAGS